MSRRAAVTALLGMLTAVAVSVAPTAGAEPFCLVLGASPQGDSKADGICIELPIDPR